ncbi:hypothetical protein MVEN_00161000 [Mycena venus]|uniref:Uncharacterized protein n=1 Tax=Mycena venus TaxID=2733690 RepID=A0A8H6Z1Y2_9AGAR|nr:hypothetical protein MVEN_00161000 [Mycena venus]
MPGGLHAVDTRRSEVESLIHALEVTWSLAAAEICLYGAYFVMFAFYLHLLRTRRMVKHGFLAIATIALFILCTVHCALVLATAILSTRIEIEIREGLERPGGANSGSFTILALAAEAVYVTTNVIADGIFVYRCYAIWNFRFKVVIFPIFLTLAVAGFGYFTVINSAVYSQFVDDTGFFLSIGISLLTTFVLMSLTVGRIWSLAWAARLMGAKVASKYRTVSAMILESGALYLIGGLAFVIVTPETSTVASLSGTVLGQLVGIAPTIIAVRVGLGYSVESVDSFVTPTPRRVVSKFRAARVESVDEILYLPSWRENGDSMILYIANKGEDSEVPAPVTVGSREDWKSSLQICRGDFLD